MGASEGRKKQQRLFMDNVATDGGADMGRIVAATACHGCTAACGAGGWFVPGADAIDEVRR